MTPRVCHEAAVDSPGTSQPVACATRVVNDWASFVPGMFNASPDFALAGTVAES